MQPYENLRILDPSDKDDIEEIHKLIHGSHIGRHKPAEQIYKLMFPSNDHYCRTVVREDFHIDNDYLDSYRKFYCLSHSEIPKHSTRLHFFACPLDVEDLFDIPSHKKQFYLGFVVIRPTPLNE